MEAARRVTSAVKFLRLVATTVTLPNACGPNSSALEHDDGGWLSKRASIEEDACR